MCMMTHCFLNLILFVVENRAALRELEGINKLINFIGRPEWSDLHVFAVMVLSNCLEDPENMEVFLYFHILKGQAKVYLQLLN